MSRLVQAWNALRGQPARTAQRGFSAARIDRLTANWMATQTAINRELQGDLDLLRARGRQLVKDNDYARKFKGMCADNIVGPNGFRYQSRVQDDPAKPDRLANAAIEKAYADWCKVADVTGRFHFNDMCRTLVGSLPSDGEFLVKIVEGKDAGNKFNFALQIIDVDRIDTQYNGTYGENTVVMGVEINAYRRPVALHIFAAHPNDGARSSRERVRIPAEDLIHFYNQEYPEQLRGVPWMAPGMLSLHHLGAFKLAALLAAEHGANHYGFFTTTDGAAPPESTDGSEQITTSVPGVYDTLPAGVNHVAHDSKYPNEVFGPFVKTSLQRIATGWRVAYHSLANDLEGVNYSSIRSGTIEERDRWMTDQDSFIEMVLERIQPRWLKMALLSGAITTPTGAPLPASKYDKFAVHEWQGRRWQWVDPKSDMEANAIAVMAGWMPPQDIAAQLGYDFDDVLVRISQAQALAKSLNVTLPAYDAKPGANGAAAGNAQGQAQSQTTSK